MEGEGGEGRIRPRRRTWTVLFAGAVAAAAAVGLSGRLVAIQVVDHDAYRSQRDGQSRVQIPTVAQRGRILDRKGKELAVSRSRVKSLFAVPPRVEDPGRLADALEPLLRIDRAEVLEALSKTDKEFVWIKRMLSESEALRVEELGEGALGFREEPQRFYPHGNLAAHVLGHVSIDHAGLEGAEAAFQPLLAGTPGYSWFERDARKRLIATPGLETLTPRDGADVFLTLEATLQYAVEEELDRAMEDFNPVSGIVILMDTRTGRILAWAVRPTFDPNRVGASPPEARRNQGITDPFEPGSIFKPLTLALAYEAGVVGPEDVFHCGGGQYTFRDGKSRRTLHDFHPYDKLTAEEVLVKSSNIGTTKIALKLGDRRLLEGVRRFGVGRKTGIDLAGEDGGWIAPKGWSFYSMTSVPWGQEVAMTPLQILCAVNALANDGLWVRPSFFLGARAADGTETHAPPPETRRVVSERSARLVRRAMVRVVEEGTGKKARLGEYALGGKTGTTCKREKDGTYSKTRSITSFVCFAPAAEPRLTLLVSLNEPRKGASFHDLTGGFCAAPLASRVLKRCLESMGVPPDPPKEDAKAKPASNRGR
ncbi:MAG: penicillin-binding protein 2 [Planctomycetes bacterium]|jgi:cell division protein FtsI/penicillin-binding protein 2|nr:penicillin-binding protein 2 [Planctomycetota bacterium]